MLSNYKLKKIKNNLEYFYNISDKKTGLNWYKDANDFCMQLSKKYDIDIYKVASVLSALSPRNKWERNILDCANVLRAVRLNKKPNAVKVCTFNTNKEKAFRIAKGEETIKETSKKTFAFVNNIARLDRNFVTIDLWHLRACFGATIKTGLTPKNYEILQEITLQEAEKVGLAGYEYQAVIWEALRNKNLY